MAAYAVTDVTTDSYYGIEDVAAALETKLQAVTDTKTIYYIDIVGDTNTNIWQGVIIHQA